MKLLFVSYCYSSKKNKIDEIFVTLDSHHKKHIAHAAFWSNKEDGAGEGPAPFSLITHDMVMNKEWFPKDCSLQVLPHTKLLFQNFIV